MIERAEVLVPSNDLSADISVLKDVGFRLDSIFPADEPRVARLSGHGVQIRIDTSAESVAPPTIRVAELGDEIETSAGARLVRAPSEFEMPALDDATVFTSGGDWGDGRAGMHYRDLIPQRHGGRVIASHIRISEPGPVPDYVHHHDIAFQMIFCRRGRVQVVYEDQGDPFWMEAGDCVLQPPNIRHRVLASEDVCEVVEIASPAEHPTHVEHEIALPTETVDPNRNFGGQRFSFDRADEMAWVERAPGWERRSTGIKAATNALASVCVLRPVDEAAPLSGTNDGELCLLFVLDGTATASTSVGSQVLSSDDSLAVANGDRWTLDGASSDFRCLEVMLGGSHP